MNSGRTKTNGPCLCLFVILSACDTVVETMTEVTRLCLLFWNKWKKWHTCKLIDNQHTQNDIMSKPSHESGTINHKNLIWYQSLVGIIKQKWSIRWTWMLSVDILIGVRLVVTCKAPLTVPPSRALGRNLTVFSWEETILLAGEMRGLIMSFLYSKHFEMSHWKMIK